MKINPHDYRVRPKDKVDLGKWPTRVKPAYRSKEEYQGMLRDHTRAAERASGTPLRLWCARDPADLPGHGCGRQGRRHQARHVGRQPAGLPGVQLQAPQRRGAGARLPVAHHARSARTRQDRDLQPLLLRGSADRARAPGDPRGRGHLGDADPKSIWEQRYRSIVDLERHLHANGTRIVKFFLHLSKEEQRKRFLERIDEPDKNWKFSEADIEERRFWKDYMKAYEKCLAPPAPGMRPGTWCPPTTRRTRG